MPIRPIYSTAFDVPDEGYYLMRVEEVKFENSDKGLSCSIRSEIVDAVENVHCIGMKVFDNFPLYTEFGRGRLLGFLIKATKMKEKEYPDDYFNDTKVQNTITSKAPNSTFGGSIKHTKGEKGIFANIREYLSTEEFKEKFGQAQKSNSQKTKEIEDEDLGW